MNRSMPIRYIFILPALAAFSLAVFAQSIHPPAIAEVAPPPSSAVSAPMPAASAPQLIPLDTIAAGSASATTASATDKKPADSAPVEGCRQLTDRAMASDLKAATAQSLRRDLAEQVALLEEAIDWWTRAALQCEGRSKERAQRNFADNQKAREKLSEQLQSGPQCEAAHKSATTLQDLARQALSDRRFLEASALFRKSDDAWDNASELCTGTQHELAIRRRDQSAIDGHNAEHCAPVFERAREQTQKLRTLAPAVSREERQEISQQAETAWREAMAVCKGGVIDAARNQAQALARERGAPWIIKPMPTLPVVSTTASPAAIAAPKTGNAVSGMNLPQVASTPVPMSSAAQAPPGTAISPANAKGVAASETSVKMLSPSASTTGGTLTPSPPPAAIPAEFTVGTTRFVGKFTRDSDSPTYSGTGRITWGNGDIYEGTFVRGKRHGKGLFIWANGQRHDGDWLDDIPTGQAKVIYANGNRYEGAVRDGLPHGSGHMQYASGDTYIGEFDNGIAQGKGLYTWKNGQTFNGEWKADRPNGQGNLRFANGNVFSGTVINGVPNGQGRIVFVTGETYAGNLVQGEPDGKGTMVWTNGDQYVGEWKAGKKHGVGLFTWKSGERWEGTHDNDVRQ